MHMKKVVDKVQGKGGFINFANRCAFELMVSSVNSACYWVHHQPEVPEEAKKYRKF